MVPLAHADAVWEAWAALDPDLRRRAREGQRLPDGHFGLPQPADCAQARGRRLLAGLAQGWTLAEIRAAAVGMEGDAWVQLALGVGALQAGQLDAAEASLRQAMNRGATREAWIGMARIEAARGRSERARAWLQRVGRGDPHPVLTAWIATRLGVTLPAPARRSAGALALRGVGLPSRDPDHWARLLSDPDQRLQAWAALRARWPEIPIPEPER